MRKNTLLLFLTIFTLVSCLDPEPNEKMTKASDSAGERIETAIPEASGVGAKNFAQINNTYASLTGVPMGGVSAEYELIKMQLPSTNSLESLNGFNQIASARLAFAYCNPYIDERSDLEAMSNSNAIDNLLNGFLDLDTVNNVDHQTMKSELNAILSNTDNLVASGNKTRLLKLTCTAILASTYVTFL
ncbi:MAG: hypothetical protein HON90_06490 [Halobacteriovoraceae bacterium]|nr:hypothetical protein [Halobacteriovoraceae bacterium]